MLTYFIFFISILAPASTTRQKKCMFYELGFYAFFLCYSEYNEQTLLF